MSTFIITTTNLEKISDAESREEDYLVWRNKKKTWNKGDPVYIIYMWYSEYFF